MAGDTPGPASGCASAGTAAASNRAMTKVDRTKFSLATLRLD